MVTTKTLTEGFFILFLFMLLYFTDQINDVNATSNEKEKFIYLSVSNLSAIDVAYYFTSPIEDVSYSTTQTPEEVEYIQPESPIGYETPCGIRGGDTSNPNRIVGGANAEPGEFPWQVSVQRFKGVSVYHLCGGAVISSYWIITAAHCVADWPASSLSIVAGDYNLYSTEGHEQRVKVARIFLPTYIKGNFTNDIALLQIQPPLHLDGRTVAPICIPESSHKFTGYGTVTGWGRLAENGAIPHILQRVTLPIMNKSRCRYLYTISGYPDQLPSKCQLCGGWEKGGLDSCQGDSGGPLACKRNDGYYYLCGIVSWGIGCARPKLPGIYTEVTCFSDWIKNIIYARSYPEIS